MFCTNCKDARIIFPEYKKDHLVEDFGCIVAKQAYILQQGNLSKHVTQLFKPIISSVFTIS